MTIVQRKLNNTRGASNEGSFTLILPKEWCDANDLKHGDDLELVLDQISPGSVLIQLPREDMTLNTNTLELNDRDHTTGASRRRSILGGYLEGYDLIRLNHVISARSNSQKRLKIRQDIQNLSQKLEGCSTNEGEHKFELTISSGLRSPIELLERLFSTTKLMFEDVFTAYLEFDHVLAEDLIQRDDQADKIYFAMVRTLKLILREPFKISGKEFALVDTLDYRMLSSNLENLCDAAEYVAQAIRGENDSTGNIQKDPKTSLSPDQISRINTIASILAEALQDSYEYYRSNDEKAAVDMAARKIEMDTYRSELSQIGVHQSLLDVVDEAVETIVDLLELVHANPEELDRK